MIIPRCQNCGPKKNSKPWSIYEYNGEIEDLYFKVTKCNQNSFEQAISGKSTDISRWGTMKAAGQIRSQLIADRGACAVGKHPLNYKPAYPLRGRGLLV